MSLGERIKENRKAKKLTQKQLAELLGGIDHSTVSKWESDTYEPDTTSLNKLAGILGVTVDYLIGGKNNKPTDDELDPEVRTLARDFKSLQPGDKELLKNLIKSMREKGKKALDE